MQQLIKHGPVTVTTNASGAATVYTDKMSAKIIAILYTPGTLDTGADLTFTGEDTATPILTVTNAGTSALFLYPRCGPVTVANAAVTNAWDYIRLKDERLKLVVAQGGDTKSGSFVVLTEE